MKNVVELLVDFGYKVEEALDTPEENAYIVKHQELGYILKVLEYKFPVKNNRHRLNWCWLHHPNVLGLKEYFIFGNKIYFVFENCNFSVAATYFSTREVQKGAQRESLCKKWTEQCLLAMKQASDLGLYYENFTFSNVCIDDNLNAKIFGVDNLKYVKPVSTLYRYYYKLFGMKGTTARQEADKKEVLDVGVGLLELLLETNIEGLNIQKEGRQQKKKPAKTNKSNMKKLKSQLSVADLSLECKDFLMNSLKRKTQDRLCLASALDHLWFKKDMHRDIFTMQLSPPFAKEHSSFSDTHFPKSASSVLPSSLAPVSPVSDSGGHEDEYAYTKEQVRFLQNVIKEPKESIMKKETLSDEQLSDGTSLVKNILMDLSSAESRSLVSTKYESAIQEPTKEGLESSLAKTVPMDLRSSKYYPPVSSKDEFATQEPIEEGLEPSLAKTIPLDLRSAKYCIPVSTEDEFAIQGPTEAGLKPSLAKTTPLDLRSSKYYPPVSSKDEFATQEPTEEGLETSLAKTTPMDLRSSKYCIPVSTKVEFAIQGRTEEGLKPNLAKSIQINLKSCESYLPVSNEDEAAIQGLREEGLGTLDKDVPPASHISKCTVAVSATLRTEIAPHTSPLQSPVSCTEENTTQAHSTATIGSGDVTPFLLEGDSMSSPAPSVMDPSTIQLHAIPKVPLETFPPPSCGTSSSSRTVTHTKQLLPSDSSTFIDIAYPGQLYPSSIGSVTSSPEELSVERSATSTLIIQDSAEVTDQPSSANQPVYMYYTTQSRLTCDKSTQVSVARFAEEHFVPSRTSSSSLSTVAFMPVLEDSTGPSDKFDLAYSTSTAAVTQSTLQLSDGSKISDQTRIFSLQPIPSAYENINVTEEQFLPAGTRITQSFPFSDVSTSSTSTNILPPPCSSTPVVLYQSGLQVATSSLEKCDAKCPVESKAPVLLEPSQLNVSMALCSQTTICPIQPFHYYDTRANSTLASTPMFSLNDTCTSSTSKSTAMFSLNDKSTSSTSKSTAMFSLNDTSTSSTLKSTAMLSLNDTSTSNDTLAISTRPLPSSDGSTSQLLSVDPRLSSKTAHKATQYLLSSSESFRRPPENSAAIDTYVVCTNHCTVTDSCNLPVATSPPDIPDITSADVYPLSSRHSVDRSISRTPNSLLEQRFSTIDVSTETKVIAQNSTFIGASGMKIAAAAPEALDVAVTPSGVECPAQLRVGPQCISEGSDYTSRHLQPVGDTASSQFEDVTEEQISTDTSVKDTVLSTVLLPFGLKGAPRPAVIIDTKPPDASALLSSKSTFLATRPLICSDGSTTSSSSVISGERSLPFRVGTIHSTLLSPSVRGVTSPSEVLDAKLSVPTAALQGTCCAFPISSRQTIDYHMQNIQFVSGLSKGVAEGQISTDTSVVGRASSTILNTFRLEAATSPAVITDTRPPSAYPKMSNQYNLRAPQPHILSDGSTSSTSAVLIEERSLPVHVGTTQSTLVCPVMRVVTSESEKFDAKQPAPSAVLQEPNQASLIPRSSRQVTDYAALCVQPISESTSSLSERITGEEISTDASIVGTAPSTVLPSFRLETSTSPPEIADTSPSSVCAKLSSPSTFHAPQPLIISDVNTSSTLAYLGKERSVAVCVGTTQSTLVCPIAQVVKSESEKLDVKRSVPSPVLQGIAQPCVVPRSRQVTDYTALSVQPVSESTSSLSELITGEEISTDASIVGTAPSTVLPSFRLETSTSPPEIADTSPSSVCAKLSSPSTFHAPQPLIISDVNTSSTLAYLGKERSVAVCVGTTQSTLVCPIAQVVTSESEKLDVKRSVPSPVLQGIAQPCVVPRSRQVTDYTALSVQPVSESTSSLSERITGEEISTDASIVGTAPSTVLPSFRLETSTSPPEIADTSPSSVCAKLSSPSTFHAPQPLIISDVSTSSTLADLGKERSVAVCVGTTQSTLVCPIAQVVTSESEKLDVKRSVPSPVLQGIAQPCVVPRSRQVTDYTALSVQPVSESTSSLSERITGEEISTDASIVGTAPSTVLPSFRLETSTSPPEIADTSPSSVCAKLSSPSTFHAPQPLIISDVNTSSTLAYLGKERSVAVCVGTTQSTLVCPIAQVVKSESEKLDVKRSVPSPVLQGIAQPCVVPRSRQVTDYTALSVQPVSESTSSLSERITGEEISTDASIVGTAPSTVLPSFRLETSTSPPEIADTSPSSVCAKLSSPSTFHAPQPLIISDVNTSSTLAYLGKERSVAVCVGTTQSTLVCPIAQVVTSESEKLDVKRSVPSPVLQDIAQPCVVPRSRQVTDYTALSVQPVSESTSSLSERITGEEISTDASIVGTAPSTVLPSFRLETSTNPPEIVDTSPSSVCAKLSSPSTFHAPQPLIISDVNTSSTLAYLGKERSVAVCVGTTQSTLVCPIAQVVTSESEKLDVKRSVPSPVLQDIAQPCVVPRSRQVTDYTALSVQPVSESTSSLSERITGEEISTDASIVGTAPSTVLPSFRLETSTSPPEIADTSPSSVCAKLSSPSTFHAPQPLIISDVSTSSTLAYLGKERSMAVCVGTTQSTLVCPIAQVVTSESEKLDVKRSVPSPVLQGIAQPCVVPRSRQVTDYTALSVQPVSESTSSLSENITVEEISPYTSAVGTAPSTVLHPFVLEGVASPFVIPDTKLSSASSKLSRQPTFHITQPSICSSESTSSTWAGYHEEVSLPVGRIQSPLVCPNVRVVSNESEKLDAEKSTPSPAMLQGTAQSRVSPRSSRQVTDDAALSVQPVSESTSSPSENITVEEISPDTSAFCGVPSDVFHPFVLEGVACPFVVLDTKQSSASSKLSSQSVFHITQPPIYSSESTSSTLPGHDEELSLPDGRIQSTLVCPSVQVVTSESQKLHASTPVVGTAPSAVLHPFLLEAIASPFEIVDTKTSSVCSELSSRSTLSAPQPPVTSNGSISSTSTGHSDELSMAIDVLEVNFGRIQSTLVCPDVPVVTSDSERLDAKQSVPSAVLQGTSQPCVVPRSSSEITDYSTQPKHPGLSKNITIVQMSTDTSVVGAAPSTVLHPFGLETVASPLVIPETKLSSTLSKLSIQSTYSSVWPLSTSDTTRPAVCPTVEIVTRPPQQLEAQRSVPSAVCQGTTHVVPRSSRQITDYTLQQIPSDSESTSSQLPSSVVAKDQTSSVTDIFGTASSADLEVARGLLVIPDTRPSSVYPKLSVQSVCPTTQAVTCSESVSKTSSVCKERFLPMEAPVSPHEKLESKLSALSALVQGTDSRSSRQIIDFATQPMPPVSENASSLSAEDTAEEISTDTSGLGTAPFAVLHSLGSEDAAGPSVVQDTRPSSVCSKLSDQSICPATHPLTSTDFSVSSTSSVSEERSLPVDISKVVETTQFISVCPRVEAATSPLEKQVAKQSIPSGVQYPAHVCVGSRSSSESSDSTTLEDVSTTAQPTALETAPKPFGKTDTKLISVAVLTSVIPVTGPSAVEPQLARQTTYFASRTISSIEENVPIEDQSLSADGHSIFDTAESTQICASVLETSSSPPPVLPAKRSVRDVTLVVSSTALVDDFPPTMAQTSSSTQVHLGLIMEHPATPFQAEIPDSAKTSICKDATSLGVQLTSSSGSPSVRSLTEPDMALTFDDVKVGTSVCEERSAPSSSESSSSATAFTQYDTDSCPSESEKGLDLPVTTGDPAASSCLETSKVHSNGFERALEKLGEVAEGLRLAVVNIAHLGAAIKSGKEQCPEVPTAPVKGVVRATADVSTTITSLSSGSSNATYWTDSVEGHAKQDVPTAAQEVTVAVESVRSLDSPELPEQVAEAQKYSSAVDEVTVTVKAIQSLDSSALAPTGTEPPAVKKWTIAVQTTPSHQLTNAETQASPSTAEERMVSVQRVLFLDPSAQRSPCLDRSEFEPYVAVAPDSCHRDVEEDSSGDRTLTSRTSEYNTAHTTALTSEASLTASNITAVSVTAFDFGRSAANVAGPSATRTLYGRDHGADISTDNGHFESKRRQIYSSSIMCATTRSRNPSRKSLAAGDKPVFFSRRRCGLESTRMDSESESTEEEEPVKCNKLSNIWCSSRMFWLYHDPNSPLLFENRLLSDNTNVKGSSDSTIIEEEMEGIALRREPWHGSHSRSSGHRSGSCQSTSAPMARHRTRKPSEIYISQTPLESLSRSHNKNMTLIREVQEDDDEAASATVSEVVEPMLPIQNQPLDDPPNLLPYFYLLLFVAVLFNVFRRLF